MKSQTPTIVKLWSEYSEFLKMGNIFWTLSPPVSEGLSKVIISVCLSVHTGGGGTTVSGPEVPSQPLIPCPFWGGGTPVLSQVLPRGYHSPVTGFVVDTPGQERTPSLGLEYPHLGLGYPSCLGTGVPPHNWLCTMGGMPLAVYHKRTFMSLPISEGWGR